MKSFFFSKFFASSISRTMIVLGILASNLLLTALAQAEEKRNDAGFAVQFGNSTNFGIQGKLGLSDNFSLRPEIFFGGGSAVENSPFNTTSPFTTPIAFTAPAGGTIPPIVGPQTATSPITILNSFPTPAAFTISAPFTTNVPITLGGNTVPAGTPVPVGTIVPAGTTIPAGFTFPVGTSIPAGFTVPAQTVPAGSNFPAGTIIPVGTRIPAGLIGSRLNGTSFGLAATYDFKLDPQGKSTAYIGPKLAFSSASGPATFNGSDIQGSKIDVSETKIGLVAGADYGISDSLSIGANVTYNLSRSVNASGSINFLGIPNISNNVQSAGSSLDFGLRASYRF
jgi:opacity protein-like surface antigen